MMRRIAAAVQIAVILLIIVFGTWQLYKGNFEASMSTLPFLVVYYLFIVSRQRRDRDGHGGDDEVEK